MNTGVPGLETRVAPGAAPTYSVVIPVYDSEEIVGRTLDACDAFFRERNTSFEIIAVNDGSRDRSWRVLRERALENPHVVAVDLLHNYGQHTAVLCGLAHSSGDWVVTLDDDLQNPPEEIEHLIAKAAEGHDLVFARFRTKRHPLVRRLGSWLIDRLNTRVFHKPNSLVLTNFRLMDRRLAERILRHRTLAPYINGLAVLYARNPGDVEVEHRGRAHGRSNYSLLKILELVFRIVFNYSSYPLRLVAAVGLIASLLSFVLAGFFFLRALLAQTTVPGWASVAVMLAFFNGLVLLLLGMLGEYTHRILRQVSVASIYEVAEVVRHGG